MIGKSLKNNKVEFSFNTIKTHATPNRLTAKQSPLYDSETFFSNSTSRKAVPYYFRKEQAVLTIS